MTVDEMIETLTALKRGNDALGSAPVVLDVEHGPPGESWSMEHEAEIQTRSSRVERWSTVVFVAPGKVRE